MRAGDPRRPHRALAPTAAAAPVLALLAALVPGAAAQPEGAPRRVELRFTPTARAQLALWIESADGTRFATVRLTQATADRGIGNRPGALQMNSGFRWPYGRREGVLPVWAHRRVAAGGTPFRRVIFQDRLSEGHASRSAPDYSVDDYFCLSFDSSKSRRDALDAVTCASTFNSDKGRYLTEDDLGDGYAEPHEPAPGTGAMRPLSLESLYPPRRDVDHPLAYDHPDLEAFGADAAAAMPELDAVTMATPAGDAPVVVRWTPPDAWENGPYVAYLEVHTEGDYNPRFDAAAHPTPSSPARCRGDVDCWDYWAKTFGYPYRGQPSVVFRVPFTLGPSGDQASTAAPHGYGALEGEDGEVRPMASGQIADDPAGAPGSGADRLRRDAATGARFSVQVAPTSLCDGETPDPRCFAECGPDAPCDDGFLCVDAACAWACDVPAAPEAPAALEVANHPDVYRAHDSARVRFEAPSSLRRIDRYELRFSRAPIVDDASFVAARPAFAATRDTVAARVPAVGEPSDLRPGDVVEVDIGQLTPLTRYWVAIRAVDDCEGASALAVAEVTTTEVHFTKVSPCFVATAAFGSPLAAEVDALRRVRDRYLLQTHLGRRFVRAYYAHGPRAAAWIARHAWLRAATRALLAPAVAVSRWVAPAEEVAPRAGAQQDRARDADAPAARHPRHGTPW